jgi:hypothetical protein
MFDRVGLWIANRIKTVMIIEAAIGLGLILYGIVSGGFVTKGY